MNYKFDELARGLAQSGTRRQALKKFGAGLAGIALACFGLAKRAEAGQRHSHLSGYCTVTSTASGLVYNGGCVDLRNCSGLNCGSCPAAGTPVGKNANIQAGACGGGCCYTYDLNKKCNC